MELKEKYELADMLIEHAGKNGANQVSVSISDNRSTEIEIRDKKIDRLKESNQSSLSVSLYVDKKYSSHSTNRLKKEELLKLVEEAIIATKYLAEDEFRTLPDPELYFKGEATDFKVFDDKLDSVDAANKIAIANKVMDEVYGKDERIISVSASYSDSVYHNVLVTSNGFKGVSSGTYVSLSSSVSVKGEKGRPNDYEYESELFTDKLKTDGIGLKALDRVLKKLNPKKLPSGKYPIVIENRVASQLIYPLYSAMQGWNIYQKQSFLIGKENQKITSELLTIVDDPTLPGSPGSRNFDDEGLVALKRPIIEKGILKGYYIDTYYGKKLGMKPTNSGYSNVVFDKGTRTMEEMVISMKKGVLITGFNGGNCNGTTGDFSYGIEGFYIENGKIVHPVNEMNITGNMNQFWFQLAEIGKDTMENRSLKIPSLMFNDADLSGV
ncbi:MAG: TldD/PmbA family protein [Bacteroidales bacterium]